MDVDKAIAQVSAAGIELTDRRRTEGNDGWVLRFANGAILTVTDRGEAKLDGRDGEAVAKILDLPTT